ncbi:DUF6241 domain-containing protein [Clostridium sp. JS66]|uniref:DUF6241 domain-containing protein n=1 Tax=Clostridium sp. JS66 TaxID=3064705 RepID=UPI00298DE329|nr:DUF6241 domain-containing protein [Clostridium sp. JS66]WPC42339.1 DUF6241 domain-containing protein [Clostridium sp. JS66]
MKKNIRNIIIGFGIITVVIGIGSYIIKLGSFTTPASHIQINNKHNDEVKIDYATNKNDSVKKDVIKKGDTRYEVATSMHLMVNGLIVAEDNAKDGVKSMSKDELNATYKLIQTLPDGAEKTNFIEIITRWKNCDFSQVVSDHNTLWKILGGGQPESTLKGRAISINQSAIKPTINLIKRGDYSKDE